MTVVVVGSGPSGAAAAAALVDHGLEVDMLDVGNEMEASAKRLAEDLRAGFAVANGHGAASTGLAVGALLRQALMTYLQHDLNWKRPFGSLFTFRDVGEYLPLTARSPRLHRSLAKGGLSNVWGAACYAFHNGDFQGWPVAPDEMDAHYRAVNSILDLSEQEDPLAELYPLYGPARTSLRLGLSCADLLAKWYRSQGVLARRGITFGRARLAVLAEPRPPRSACVYCGRCLTGCPQGAIYNATFTVDELRRRRNFRYRPGLFVRRFEELGSGRVVLHAEDVRTRDLLRLEYDALFLAAGSLSSLRIACDSLRASRSLATLLDNNMFLVPLVKATDWQPFDPDVAFTLSQLVLVLTAKEVCSKPVHIQLYSCSHVVSGSPTAAFRWLPQPARDRVARLLGNTMLAACYLHSDHSARLEARVIPSPSDGVGTIDITSRENPDERLIIKRLLKHLAGLRQELDLVLIRWALKRGRPGFSGHLAGSLPMKTMPGELETTSDGRLHGTRSVYVADQSTFPTLPAQNPTYTAMANAHRIATLFARARPCS